MPVLLSEGRKNIKKVIHQVLDAFLKDEDYERGIFIKPNIVFPVRQGSGEITSTSLVKALVEALRERRSDIDIILGEGVAAGGDPQENFDVSGFSELARQLNIPLVDLHSTERQTFTWKFGKLKLPSLALKHTYINLPILKPSNACVISGALKNQKGLVPAAVKKQFHRLGLHEQIAELNVVIRPALTIMDCSNFFGRNALMSGNNCGEIDATACRLLGINEPEHVQLSRNAGVFTDGYSITGEDIRLKRGTNRPVVPEFKTMGRLRLWSNPRACSRCRYLFQEIQQDLLKSENLQAAAKLLPYSFKGAEIIIGSASKWEKEYQAVICVGECTRLLAKEGDYIHIPGCPPRLSDLSDNLP